MTSQNMSSTYDPSQSSTSAYDMALTAGLGSLCLAATVYGGKLALQSLGPTTLGTWLGCTGSSRTKTGVKFDNTEAWKTRRRGNPKTYESLRAKDRHPGSLFLDEMESLNIDPHATTHDPKKAEKRYNIEKRKRESNLGPNSRPAHPTSASSENPTFRRKKRPTVESDYPDESLFFSFDTHSSDRR